MLEEKSLLGAALIHQRPTLTWSFPSVTAKATLKMSVSCPLNVVRLLHVTRKTALTELVSVSGLGYAPIESRPRLPKTSDYKV